MMKRLISFSILLTVGLFAYGITCQASSDTYRVSVSSGYLALRDAQSFDYSNEIGSLYTGDTVEVDQYGGGTYWYVYSPKYNKYGYVNKNYLVYAGDSKKASGSVYSVKVSSGYLALRNAKAYDYSNEIGSLYTGDTVTIQDTSDSTYWYVYSPKYNKYGYVNKDYLVYKSGPASDQYTVSVSSGYLALRSAKAYDSGNEIGSLYTGDTVTVQDKSDSTYWYVYSPKYNKYGYVNKNYLTAPKTSGKSMTVKVSSGYLALRTAKAYDSSNEIGSLYTGDTVNVQDTSDSQYWYVYSPKYNKYGYVNKDYLY